ncbi:MAG: phosphoadenosine phosphosulfate reductase family protein [Clostridiales bacterium]|nr:phosphoadenosine phosphosulfate reductase family protein [Clostridiales bacterium]
MSIFDKAQIRFIRDCTRLNKDFTDEEIWEYIHKYNLPYCELYDRGWDRIGCIGCPLGTNQSKELEEYPAYKENYIRAFDGMIKYRKNKGMETEWETGKDIYDWWIGEIKKDNSIEGQCSMF